MRTKGAMETPKFIRKILHREPVKPCPPSLAVKENFLAFLNKPSVDGFEILRQQVAASDRYAPYSNELDILMAALCAGEPQAAIDLFWRSFPNLLLSPLAHFILSQAYLDLKREGEAEGEKAMGRLILNKNAMVAS